MSVLASIRSGLNRLIKGEQESYELDSRWQALLEELRDDVEENGFDLEENEHLYLGVVAQIARENEEGLQKLADEEVAEKARVDQETEIDREGLKTIKIVPPKD